jgi:hypothetical protein
VVYTVFWTPYVVREHLPAMALVERGSLNVERYLGWTEDVFPSPKGGAFINNNPGASLTGAIPLLLLRPVMTRVDRWNQTLPRSHRDRDQGEFFERAVADGRGYYFLLVAFATVALAMAPATAGAAAYLCARLEGAGLAPASAARVALLCSLATPVLFRAGHLNHNLLVGDAGFVALLLLWDANDRPLGPGHAAGAGLLAGYAVLCDYSGVVVAAASALYAWLRCSGQPAARRLPVMLAYAAGFLPGVAVLAIYQAWAFGSPLLPSQHYMLPTAPTSHGYRGFDWPSPALAWANLVDPRFGLLAYCPVLILAFAAPFVARGRYRVPRRETWVIFLYFALFALFCSANQYSWLQPATGFRYLVPVVPFLALLAVQTAQALPRWARRAVGVVAIVQSVVIAAARENDIRLSVSTLWQRRLALFWMIRLREVGAPVTWAWTLGTWAVLILVLFIIWAAPFIASRRDIRA